MFEATATAPIQKEDWLKLRARLFRYARMVVHEPTLAEDLAQQSLMSVLEHPMAQHQEASLTTWATAILKHKISDWYRSPYQSRRLYESPAGDESVPSPGCETCSAPCIYRENLAAPACMQPEGQLARRQIMMVVDHCVGVLPALPKKVFIMHECLGFETSEVSEHLRITNDHCRTILHRARLQVRQCVTTHGHSIPDFS